MDARGRQGSVSLDEMLSTHWSGFTAQAALNGVKPLLAFSYAEQGSADKTVFVDVSKVAKNSDGTYSLFGQLMADAPAQEGRVDAWDYLGINYKSSYERFLNASGLKDCKSGAVCSSVSAVGILAATTFSVASAGEAGYHDYPLPTDATPSASATTQLSPGQLGWGTLDTTTSNGHTDSIPGGFGNGGATNVTELTALIQYSSGGSFLTATNLNSTYPGANNGVNLYAATTPTGQAPTWASPAVILQGTTNTQASSFTSPVVAMLEYSVPQYAQITGTGYISNGNTPATFNGSISGTTLTVNSMTSGTIETGTYVVGSVNGGPQNNTQVTGFGPETTGGIGTYTITPSQTWPAASGSSGTMNSGVSGTALSITLPEGVTPSSLVGKTVTGPDVAAGTTISSYTSTVGGVSTFAVNNYSLTGISDLTIIIPEVVGATFATTGGGATSPIPMTLTAGPVAAQFNAGISSGPGSRSEEHTSHLQSRV
jgi:hypothetical protein